MAAQGLRAADGNGAQGLALANQQSVGIAFKVLRAILPEDLAQGHHTRSRMTWLMLSSARCCPGG